MMFFAYSFSVVVQQYTELRTVFRHVGHAKNCLPRVS